MGRSKYVNILYKYDMGFFGYNVIIRNGVCPILFKKSVQVRFEDRRSLLFCTLRKVSVLTEICFAVVKALGLKYM